MSSSARFGARAGQKVLTLQGAMPRPRLHRIRFHDVLAPNAKLRALVVPHEPDASAQKPKPTKCEAGCAHHRPVRLSWVKLLKRVFESDMEHCPNCSGDLKIIAVILEAPVLKTLLKRAGLQGQGTASGANSSPGTSSGLTSPNANRSGDPATRRHGQLESAAS